MQQQFTVVVLQMLPHDRVDLVDLVEQRRAELLCGHRLVETRHHRQPGSCEEADHERGEQRERDD